MEVILVRHGKPEGAVNPRVTAVGFARWVRNYDHSRVMAHSLPPENVRELVAGSLIVASDLPRAIHSAELCSGEKPDITLRLMREMEIPRYRLPFICRVNTWVLVNRLLWLFGVRGWGESYTQAKKRAKVAAVELHKMSQRSPKITLFGHTLMNRYIAKELVNLGWGGKPKFNRYWGFMVLRA